MSVRRQPRLSPPDEPFLLVRTMLPHCAPGLRTSSPTREWHRLVAAAEGVVIVRTPDGAWSSPTASAVWVPAGVRCDLEMCRSTVLQMLYIRPARGAALPIACQVVSVSP